MSEADAHGLGRAELVEIYRALVLARAAEERVEILREQGHLTGEASRSRGKEAGAVGAAFALRRRTDGSGDVLAPTRRATGALFLFGADVGDYFRQHLARGTGPTRGRERDVHWFDFGRGFIGPVSPPGTMVEVMAGITLAFRLRGEERIGLVFDGDEASATGSWHEGLNFAAAQRCPMILIVERDQGASPRSGTSHTRVKSFTEKGPGYGIGADSVDGGDVLAVFDVVRRAATRVRSGEGTRLVEVRYAPDDEPIELYRARVIEHGWADPEELLAIDVEEFERCRVAAEQALTEALPVGADAVLDVYHDAHAPHPWTRADQPDPALA